MHPPIRLPIMHPIPRTDKYHAWFYLGQSNFVIVPISDEQCNLYIGTHTDPWPVALSTDELRKQLFDHYRNKA